jgi:hypothetical protein
MTVNFGGVRLNVQIELTGESDTLSAAEQAYRAAQVDRVAENTRYSVQLDLVY